MENNRENKPTKIATKGQFRFLVASNVFIILTIAVIIYELYNKIEHFASYIMLGVFFILMSINQYIYYKNNKGLNYIIMGVIYTIIGLALIIYTLFIK